MHLLVIWASLAGCVLAQPPFRQVPRPIQRPIPAPSGGGRVIAIIREQQDVNIDGSYQWSYETENGIAAQETGQLKAGSPDPILDVQGSFQYTAPDGTPISVTYTSNENGFLAQGPHLPTPPPIPPEILKALAYNAAHPEEDNDGGGQPRGGPRRF